MLFTEAIRKTRGLYQGYARRLTRNLEEAFADVLSYLLDLANAFQSRSGAGFPRQGSGQRDQNLELRGLVR